MNEPIWLNRQSVILLQAESLAQHCGSSGIRDTTSLLDSVLARPPNKWNYNAEPDLATLAAAYGIGLARNHPFVDGNKRIAFIATALFLRLNGYRLSSDPLNEIQTMLRLAAGELSEEEFAVWIRNHTKSTK
jgi:death-on-curing protein